MQPRWIAERIFPLSVLLLLVDVGCGPPAERPTTSELTFLNQDPAVAYVGREQCQSCHLGLFTTFTHSGMGRSAYPLTADNVVEDFTDDNEFVVEETGLHYKMYEKDGRFYQRQFVLDSSGAEMAADARELTLVIGSNHHNRSYVTQVGDRLFQAPVCWYPQASKWDLCPGFEHKNDHFAREISASCVFCHNGRMELVAGERNVYRQPIPHGIGCERCHGPGELHVARWNSSDEEPSGEPDPTIVNPRRLERRERLAICLQCHLGDAKQTERVARHGRTPESFRPGQRITEVIAPLRFVEQTHYDFGLSAQADRLMQSRCFKETEGKIECLTCHNPHLTVYHEERPRDFFRKKCVSCHEMDDCTAPDDRRQQTAGLADDCVACHMRKAEPDDQRFTEFTDHWIRRNVDLSERDHRASFELESVFPDDFAALPEGEQAYYRARANFLMADEAPQPAGGEMLRRAEREFRTAIERGFDNEAAWFFLGKTLALMGKGDEAVEAFETAVERDPTYRDAQFALGQSLSGMGQAERALEIFRGMLDRRPDDPMALAEFGRLSFQSGDPESALAAYRVALEREPGNSTLQLNLGMTLAGVGNFADAARAGEQAVRLNPDSRDAWSLYWNAMREAGRDAEAREGRLQFDRLEGR